MICPFLNHKRHIDLVNHNLYLLIRITMIFKILSCGVPDVSHPIQTHYTLRWNPTLDHDLFHMPFDGHVATVLSNGSSIGGFITLYDQGAIHIEEKNRLGHCIPLIEDCLI